MRHDQPSAESERLAHAAVEEIRGVQWAINQAAHAWSTRGHASGGTTRSLMAARRVAREVPVASIETHVSSRMGAPSHFDPHEK